MFTDEETAALEKFLATVRRRDYERRVSKSPSGRRTLLFPGEPMPDPGHPESGVFRTLPLTVYGERKAWTSCA